MEVFRYELYKHRKPRVILMLTLLSLMITAAVIMPTPRATGVESDAIITKQSLFCCSERAKILSDAAILGLQFRILDTMKSQNYLDYKCKYKFEQLFSVAFLYSYGQSQFIWHSAKNLRVNDENNEKWVNHDICQGWLSASAKLMRFLVTK